MKNASELLEEAVYAGNLSENEEKRLYSWIESLILAKRKADEYEAKAKAFDRIVDEMNTAGATMHKKESLVQYAAINAFWNIDEIIVDYESGESQ